MLLDKLETLRPQLASAAQRIYDEWQQDADGVDEVYGSGGCCDDISQEIAGVIASAYDDVSITEAGQPGDDHASIIAFDQNEAYIVDIPPSVYEEGGGYSWKKIEGVEITPEDVEIYSLNLSPEDIAEFQTEASNNLDRAIDLLAQFQMTDAINFWDLGMSRDQVAALISQVPLRGAYRITDDSILLDNARDAQAIWDYFQMNM